jgi:hypothetical protein
MPVLPHQRTLYDSLQKHKHIFIKKPRGIGVTEFLLRYIAWYCIFCKNQNKAFLLSSNRGINERVWNPWYVFCLPLETYHILLSSTTIVLYYTSKKYLKTGDRWLTKNQSIIIKTATLISH